MKGPDVLGVKVKRDDIDRFVHDQLESGGVWTERDDMDNAAGLGRAIDSLGNTSLQQDFVSAALKFVTDRQPVVRAGSLQIVRSYGRLVGAAPRLLAAWRENPDLFRNVREPATGQDLESLLLAAMAASALPGDQAVLDTLHEIIRDPDKRDLVLAGLTRADPDWMVEHVFDWLGDDGGRIVAILVNVPDEAKVERVARAIAKAPAHVRDEAAEAIRRFVPDRDRAAHLISLLSAQPR